MPSKPTPNSPVRANDIPPAMAEQAKLSVLRPVQMEVERIFPVNERVGKWKDLSEAKTIRVIYPQNGNDPYELEIPNHRVQLEAMKEIGKLAGDYPMEEVNHNLRGVVLHVRYGHPGNGRTHLDNER